MPDQFKCNELRTEINGMELITTQMMFTLRHLLLQCNRSSPPAWSLDACRSHLPSDRLSFMFDFRLFIII